MNWPLAALLLATAIVDAPPALARDGDGLFPGVVAAMKPLKVPNGVRRLADVTYGPDARQRIDVYLPQTPPAAPMPVIVMVHGGAWMVGNKAMPQVVDNKVARWVTQGAVLVSVGAKPWLGSVALDSAALNLGGMMSGPHARDAVQAFFDTIGLGAR